MFPRLHVGALAAPAFSLLLAACSDERCPEGSIRQLDGLCHLLDTDTGAPEVDDAEPLAIALDPELRAHIAATSPLPAPPPNPSNRVADDPDAAELGRQLFFEARFSRSGQLSCATCHDPAQSYTDGKRVAFGEELYPRNTGSLVDIVWYDWILWDGGCDTIWCQAHKPLENRHEMNADRVGTAHVIASDPTLLASYERVFGSLPDLSNTARFPEHARPDHLDPEGPLNLAWESMDVDDQVVINTILANVSKALEAFQRTLRSGPTPYDTFAAGVESGDPEALSALSASAQRGLVLFFGKAQCSTCHDGPT